MRCYRPQLSSTAIGLLRLPSRRLASSTPVEFYLLAMAPALPLSHLGVMEAGAPAVRQNDIVAKRGGPVQKPCDISLRSHQGRDYQLTNISDSRSRLLVAGLDVDRSFITGQEVGNEGPDHLEYSTPLPANDGFQSIPLLLRDARVEVEPPRTVPS